MRGVFDLMANFYNQSDRQQQADAKQGRIGVVAAPGPLPHVFKIAACSAPDVIPFGIDRK